MGKRKERRLAAKIGAGRRVKLDLLAEPCEDSGGSSAKDEVGKLVDTKLDQELPSSPSSGQPAENPLSLLGQYSDDDLDEVSNKKVVGSDVVNQVKGSAVEQLEEGEVSGNEELSNLEADNQVQGGDSAIDIAAHVATDDEVTANLVSLDEKPDAVSSGKQDPVFMPIVGTQPSGDMDSGWKMVLDEESNKYYYWNTVTGATSWEVPGNLNQTVLTNGLENLGEEMGERSAGDARNTTAFSTKLFDLSASNGVGYSGGNSEMKLVYEQAPPQSHSVEQCKVDGNQLLGISSVVGALPYETSSNYVLLEQYNSALGSSTMGSYDVHGHCVSSENSIDFPSHLVNYCEALLQRLNSVQSSGTGADLSAWLSKYISEIEVRLSDIRALLPYGSSLSPFWLHSQRQLNQLENAVNAVTGKQGVEPSAEHLNLTEVKDAKLEGRVEKLMVDEESAKLSPEKVAAKLDIDDSAVVQKLLDVKSSDDSSVNVPQMSLSEPTTESHLGEAGSLEVNVPHRTASSVIGVQSSEDANMDVDMDVDMEVEVPSPLGTRVTDTGSILLAPSVQQSAPVLGQCPSSESEVVPPPPDEDWIPPPPPDIEGIPPPPPDEPPEALYPPPPPSELEPEPVPVSVQSIYSEQYNSAYTESNVNYYGNTSLLSSGNSFYEHANGNQIDAVNLPVYYAAVSNPQAETVLTPPNNAVYYGLQNGVSPVVPLVHSIVSSSTQAAANNLNCDAPLTSEIATVGVSGEECSTSQIVDSLASSSKCEIFSSPVSSGNSVKEHASVSSLSAAATSSTSINTLPPASDAAAAALKVQSKASKMKKPKVPVVPVGSSLRSNKKVSSMVDKWKAAKEELQEEEEDRETPLEILEKKRRRDIEVWRAQQLASGEAKENANFQPLGGDWRERVKRRRAQKQASPRTSPDAVDDGNKQPDLITLSKDLPPGWQAYWDDSSSQVYYSNALTSETTWTRPTR